MGLAMMGTGIAEGTDRAMEAARRAISSPLLEGASVNGARGVIINVTGGPDLSLVEVSEASCIVQEAADEDANIIFGAVIDPSLKGKVKITVIATGFGAQPATRPAASPSQTSTPVDMTQYADYARMRNDAVPVPAPAAAMPARMSIARRPLLDLPMAASGGSPSMAPPSSAPPPPAITGSSAAAAAPEADTMRLDAPLAGPAVDPDFDLSSTFDVPAFLRRQEG
jgi:cell division protein FtsZ